MYNVGEKTSCHANNNHAAAWQYGMAANGSI